MKKHVRALLAGAFSFSVLTASTASADEQTAPALSKVEKAPQTQLVAPLSLDKHAELLARDRMRNAQERLSEAYERDLEQRLTTRRVASVD